MRPAKILLRLKGGGSQVKAFVNVRDHNKSHPKQLHLGYLNIHQDLDIAKERIFRVLVEKWPRRRTPQTIDWEDAEKKLSKLRLVFGERVRLSEQEPDASHSVATTTPMPSQPDASITLDATTELRQRRVSPPSWHAELVNVLPQLKQMASRMTKDAAEADDLVQTTLESALRSHEDFRGRSSLTSWLLGIMTHRYYDSLRSARVRGHHLRIDIDDFEIAAVQEDEELWRKFTLEDLKKQTPHIEDSDWLLLDLIYVERQTYQQVAQLFDIQVNTVFSRLARTRQRIMRYWHRARARPSNLAFSRVIHGDADASDPDVVRIAFVYLGAEHESAIAPPGTDHGPLLDELIRLMNLPIEAVRAYRGSVLLEERPLLARGADKTP